MFCFRGESKIIKKEPIFICLTVLELHDGSSNLLPNLRMHRRIAIRRGSNGDAIALAARHLCNWTGCAGPGGLGGHSKAGRGELSKMLCGSARHG